MGTATKAATKSKIITIPPQAKTNGHKTSEHYVIPLADDAEPQPFQTIDITKIDADTDHIVTDDLNNLVSSIADVGLLNPITVIQSTKNRYLLIAGRHRLAVCKQLGWTNIPVHIVSFDEQDDTRAALLAELATIDENLVRRQLSELDFAELLQRRKDIYEALYPETKHGGDRTQHPSLGSCSPRPRAFIDETGAITGRSRSTVGEYLQIAKHLDSDVKTKLRDTPVADRKMDLLALARMPPEKQHATAEAIVSQEIPTVGEALQAIREPQPKKKKSLNDGVGLMGFFEDVKDYAYRKIEQYTESDILSHEFDSKNGQVILVLTLKDD